MDSRDILELFNVAELEQNTIDFEIDVIYNIDMINILMNSRDISMAEKMYSVPQAARLLGVSPMTMQKIIDAGEIAAYQIGGRWKVPESAITRYLQEHSNQPRS